MKKKSYLFFIILFLTGVAYSNPVSVSRAQAVAANFYAHNLKSSPSTLTLAYTEQASDGQPVYYVFNVNTNNGFVIVSAEDAAHPILGYSNKGKYVIPPNNNNLAWWMNCRKQEIIYARNINKTAAAEISNEWISYTNATFTQSPKAASGGSGLAPLCRTSWDQAPYYNDMCPGGPSNPSVTGCVATAMAQIMRYWAYPSHGHGYNYYWDEQANGFQNNYGYIRADYDTSHYIWTAMPDSIVAPNHAIAELMYDCGVSVNMDYSPFESGAWVIIGDYPVCAQTAYVKYFGYNPATLQGLYDSSYTATEWTNLIKNELNHGRPVQYVGWDSTNNDAGHTWVCDGYQNNPGDTLFDMNWGWGGSDDGYYALNALNPSYHFNWWNEILIGIEPPPTSPYFTPSLTFGCAHSNLTVNFKDSSISKSTVTAYKWLFPGGSPSTANVANPTITYNTAGSYAVTEIVIDASGSDTLVKKACIAVDSTLSLPVAQGFESATFPPVGWVLNNPHNYSYTWQLNTGIGGHGTSTQSMYFNNCQGYDDYAPPGKPGNDITGQKQQIYTPEYNFTNATNPTIYFDIAYAPFQWNGKIFSDTLAIYYSTDCGATFTQVYCKGGLTLSTTGGYVHGDTNKIGCFTPANNSWRTDTIHIPAIVGAASVLFSFENRSGNGSPLYIDNINISDTAVPASIPTVSSTPSIRVYPNPSNGIFNIELKNVELGIKNVEIYNVLGEQVYSQSSINNSQFQINLSSQPEGVYIYRMFSENGSAIFTGRLVVE